VGTRRENNQNKNTGGRRKEESSFGCPRKTLGCAPAESGRGRERTNARQRACGKYWKNSRPDPDEKVIGGVIGECEKKNENASGGPQGPYCATIKVG